METNDANAAVTDAAPELLAALKRLESSRTFSIDHEENRRIGSERYDLREMIHVAIAKAEGR